ncbi:transposase [Arthrobacter sp. UYEF20]|uniref:transposase n=1 Tax=Arthrobacter sp. UYEF20 TaxID=1756363 RepID=UPI003397EAC1
MVAFGVAADGRREVLGFDVGDGENETFWTAFLRSLNARGPAGVKLFHPRCPAGLKKTIWTAFPDTAWQLCRVDFMRKALSIARKDPGRWSPRSSASSQPCPMRVRGHPVRRSRPDAGHMPYKDRRDARRRAPQVAQ